MYNRRSDAYINLSHSLQVLQDKPCQHWLNELETEPIHFCIWFGPKRDTEQEFKLFGKKQNITVVLIERNCVQRQSNNASNTY